jgi:alkylation response protein AidB-like acyl-CoA dehydrogenase
MDQPIFLPTEWSLTPQQQDLSTQARELGYKTFAKRASTYDKTASFPTENYIDLHKAGLLGVCIPADQGGHGASLKTYMLMAAEIGRYCGATALTFNMHVSSCLWSGELIDALDLDADQMQAHRDNRNLHYQRILNDGAIYAQPFSEGGAAAAGKAAFSTTATKADGGWVINGKKIFASLSGHANYYGALCTELENANSEHLQRNTLYIAVPADAKGVRVEGEWDPLGMRGTVSRTLIFDNVFVEKKEQLMPPGVYRRAASQWPHMFMTLTPSYMGLAQAAYDFAVKYLRGEVEGTPPVKRRMYPTKQLAVAQMRIMLEQTKSVWFQSIA